MAQAMRAAAMALLGAALLLAAPAGAQEIDNFNEVDLESIGMIAAAGICNHCNPLTGVCDNHYFRWGFATLNECKAVITSPTSLLTDPYAFRLDVDSSVEKRTDCIPAARRPDNGTGFYFIFGADSCRAGPADPNMTVAIYDDEHCTSTVGVLEIKHADGACQPAKIAYEEPEGEEKWTTRFIIIIVLTPFVTAIIGYGTNVIAIKMIFKPYDPKCGFSIGLCGQSKANPGQARCHFRGIQGVFPKRQHELALQIGNMVEKNLISADEMVEQMKKQLGMDDEGAADSKGAPKESGIDAELSEGVRNAVAGMLEKRQDTPGFGFFLTAMGGKEAFRDNLTRGTVSAFKQNLPYLMEVFADSFTKCIPFSEIITDRIRNKMTPKDLEDMFMSFMSTELGFVEQLGGVLGFIVGILQSCIFIVAGT